MTVLVLKDTLDLTREDIDSNDLHFRYWVIFIFEVGPRHIVECALQGHLFYLNLEKLYAT